MPVTLALRLFKYFSKPLFIGLLSLTGVAVGLGFIRHQQHQINLLNHAKAELVLRNQELASENQQLGRQYQKTMAAYEALSKKRQLIKNKAQKVIKRIRKAPKSADAPLAPVLKDALEAL